MEDRDIEKYLKESADEVQVKDFSERWEKFKGRIDSAQEAELKETTSETVLATSSNGTVSNNSVKKKWIYSLSAVFLAIALCLAIVLPLTLKKDITPDDIGPNDIAPDDIVPQFWNFHDLLPDAVSADEFYGKIEETGLKIFNTENFEVNNYVLLYTEDNKVAGGKLEIADEEIFATVVFYDTSVKSSFEIGAEYKAYAINGFNIEYKTELDEDELYSTTAQAIGINICYEFECLSLDENIESFFNKLFG